MEAASKAGQVVDPDRETQVSAIATGIVASRATRAVLDFLAIGRDFRGDECRRLWRLIPPKLLSPAPRRT